MVRMSSEQLRAAVEAAGDYELIDDDEAESSAQSDASAAAARSYTTESVEELRKRYLGDNAVSDDQMLVGSDSSEAEGATPKAFEDELVVVRPKTRGPAFSIGPGPKSLVISGKDGKPLGAQG
jgi:hypothetical protein